MLQSILDVIGDAFLAIGRGLRWLVSVIVWPFGAAGRWLGRRGWLIKGPVLAVLVLFAGLYAYFVWNTQHWAGFDPDYVQSYGFASRELAAGEAGPDTPTNERSCGRSAMADVTSDLIDFNVNRNAWISSMLLYKVGFFGMDWDRTPFLDNQASFQRGINQAIRRTSIELVDTLGRVRGTSQIDQNLQDARGNLQFDEYTWYFGFNPFGFKTPTPAFHRSAIRSINAFNDRLQRCEATFDARADNLIQFIDRVASDLGSTSAILRERSEGYNYGWFDTRADDRFWFAYGQLYGYYGIFHAAGSDFRDVIRQRSVGPLWQQTEQQLRAALNIRPFIISNGNEAGWIMPTHLATMGFYVLRVRSNMVELRSVLDR